MGVLIVMVEKIFVGMEFIFVLCMFEDYFGWKVDVIMLIECGGINLMILFIVVVEIGLLVVDVDGMG